MNKPHMHTSAAAWRRQQQLEDCLHQNLMQKPYASISVADLCTQVGISRKAFYNYFHSKDDCLISLMQRSIRETILHTEALDPACFTTLEGCIRQMEYWKNNRREFLDMIIHNNLGGYYLWANVRYFAEEETSLMQLTSTEEVATDMDLISAMTNALLTVIFQWYLRGFDTPTEEVAKKYHRLLNFPIVPEQG